MHKIFLTILLVCICTLYVRSQDTTYSIDTVYSSPAQTAGDDISEDSRDEDADILSDTTVFISDLKISGDSVRSWKTNKRFAYMRDMDSLLRLQKQLAEDSFKDRSGDTSDSFLTKLLSSGIVQAIFWVIAIGFVLFILYRLFLNNGVFKRNTVIKNVHEVTEEEEVSNSTDYDRLIKQSVQQTDFRMATRYLFLKTLARLRDKEYIHFSADKTNYQYVQEVPGEKRNEFASLVLNYEYTWYGNFPLKSEQYTVIENKFNSFNNKV